MVTHFEAALDLCRLQALIFQIATAKINKPSTIMRPANAFKLVGSSMAVAVSGFEVVVAGVASMTDVAGRAVTEEETPP
jgi:hypothetical protein